MESLSNGATITSCCAAIYQSDWARVLLGDSFHPGGVDLTEHLGRLLALDATTRVLDVASGPGTSAIHLAKTFGCHVTGIEFGADAVEAATMSAITAGVADTVRFIQGDAEAMPIANNSFDVVICECAFCTFPDKKTAAHEFMRVLRPGGTVGISDLTRMVETVPTELQTLLAWVACIADAQPLQEYQRLLQEAGFTITTTEAHDDALASLIHAIQGRVIGAEMLVKLQQISLPVTIDFAQAKTMARAAKTAVSQGQFGYSVILASKPIQDEAIF